MLQVGVIESLSGSSIQDIFQQLATGPVQVTGRLRNYECKFLLL